MNAWLQDLQSVGYIFPALINQRKTQELVVQKRAAVCVTGVIECIHEAWEQSEHEIHRRLNGDIDTFLFLSSTEPKGVTPPIVPLEKRLKDARLYNATVKILYEDRPLDPGLPSSCQTNYQIPPPYVQLADYKIPQYFQQLWALAKSLSKSNFR
ncbi:unnamed protein product [Didymodactylos carnosus]|uniref:Uncharacterized protein n=1 Tax=Didymodactylos carnosus TaxID=1234261 RepID=A0A814YRG6_9BILA|nr:unnamed protein product [Didymodactylos carnosus]CAF1233914.1 unnamed protein product [Didymodactylos carnosus]CAF3793169.1 unnamed protein product [Didymodactylos carnosus]CAF3996491.1 unnamed protein product [Didymodactylos carnosus]